MFDVVSVESILHFVRFQCVMSENIVVAFYLDCVHLEQLSWWLSPLNLYLSIFFFLIYLTDVSTFIIEDSALLSF